MVGVLNLGGIANLSLLHPDGEVFGFDCGPGNALMDGWCQLHTGALWDDDGRWAASGRVIQALLDAFLAEPYFQQPPPKSTGRDLFHPAWLANCLALAGTEGAAPADVQATLLELTARSVAQDVRRHAPGLKTLIVCGGGALNLQMMQRLAALLPDAMVQSSVAYGLPPLQVEAAAFAWLARKAVAREALATQRITGARGARVLGAIYPR
jgi:anhydro-N-acetylmuramic acid kinase